MANSLNLNSAYYYIFRNLSMITYIIEIQKSKFANIKFHEFDQSEPGSYIDVYFHPVGYTCDLIWPYMLWMRKSYFKYKIPEKFNHSCEYLLFMYLYTDISAADSYTVRWLFADVDILLALCCLTHMLLLHDQCFLQQRFVLSVCSKEYEEKLYRILNKQWFQVLWSTRNCKIF